jgi:hypothetical protein
MSMFDIKDKFDKLIYKAFNILSDVLFHLSLKTKKLIAKNKNFRNIHLNERCFILGTGPSLNLLTSDEINKLKSENLFGVNSFYKAPISSILKPKYYALTDDLYWKDWKMVFNEVVEKFADNPPIFITDPRARELIDELRLVEQTIYVYAKKYPTNAMSDELTKNIYVTMNVVSSSILVAMYMGFKEIYLLGCDYNAFCSSGRGHFYDDEEDLEGISYNLAFFLKYYWITTEFHYLIAKLAKKKGIKIINLTPTSLLDAYSIKNVSEVF